MMPLRSAVRRLARKIGYDIIPYTAASSGSYRRQVLLDSYSITAVIDVGANTGQYGRELRRAGYRGKIVSFEPLPTAFENLCRVASLDGNWVCHGIALGETDDVVELHVAGNSVSSSILPMLDAHTSAEPTSAYTTSVQVPLHRLDDLASDILQSEDRLSLKLDVQGYELAVLNGAANTIENAYLIECELSLIPLYKGQLLYREMIDHLYSLGFDLVGIDPGFVDVSSGRLLQVDGVFARIQF